MNNTCQYKLKKPINSVMNRSLLCLVIIFFMLTIKKVDPDVAKNIKKNIFNKSFNFIKVNTLTKKVLGKEFIYYQKMPNSINVFSEDIGGNISHKFFDGEKYDVSENLPIGIFESGVVIYRGYKENFKNTVIIQGIDNYNIWYGNLKDINVNLYEYVEKNSLIGSADGKEVYILIEKDDKFYTYEDYKKSKY